MWYRVFCRDSQSLSPAKLLEQLHADGLIVEGHFRGDDLGWTGAELRLGTGSPILMERFLTAEDDLRNDLNSWAAFLETCDYSPNHARLMEHVIQASQMITLRKPIDHADDVSVEKMCLLICRLLATAGDGVYQIDEEGWFAANGEMLLKEY